MRRLEGPEIQSYDVLSRELAERVRIVRVPVLPFGSSGMAVGRFVLLRTDNDRSGNRKLLAHELIHVRQWHEAGCWAFLRTYLGDYFRELRSTIVVTETPIWPSEPSGKPSPKPTIGRDVSSREVPRLRLRPAKAERRRSPAAPVAPGESRASRSPAAPVAPGESRAS